MKPECTGRCETAAGCDCWPAYVARTPMLEPHPWRRPPLAAAEAVMAAVIIALLLAAVVAGLGLLMRPT